MNDGARLSRARLAQAGCSAVRLGNASQGIVTQRGTLRRDA